MDISQKAIGEFTRHTTCRFCQSPNMIKFLDFGDVPLAGAFLTREQFANEKFYPLEVQFCQACTLVQVNNAVPADVLFKNYFYFSSAIQTLVTHFRDMASEIAERFCTKEQAFVVELGCNDGVLLKPLLELGVKCVGVDPATNVVQSSGLSASQIVNDYFTEKVARHIHKIHGQADVIVSSFSFAHIDDMVDVMRGVQELLKDDGVFIFEVYYLGIVIDEMQYDMIYHEHMSYYSLTALMKFFTRFDMEIFEVKHIPLRAGTIRFYSRKTGRRHETISPTVRELLAYEQNHGLDKLATYQQFAKRVEGTKLQLMGLLEELKREGKTLIGYGASGRATTIMNYCGIDTRHLDYVVDDAPAKHGLYTPGTHVPIKPWTATENPPRPDYALIFAWSFIDEVKRRRMDYLQQGGKFIVPLPEVSIIGG
jgi:methylation protein EvaC